jgi:hypothetical protein
MPWVSVVRKHNFSPILLLSLRLSSPCLDSMLSV